MAPAPAAIAMPGTPAGEYWAGLTGSIARVVRYVEVGEPGRWD